MVEGKKDPPVLVGGKRNALYETHALEIESNLDHTNNNLMGPPNSKAGSNKNRWNQDGTRNTEHDSDYNKNSRYQGL